VRRKFEHPARFGWCLISDGSENRPYVVKMEKAHITIRRAKYELRKKEFYESMLHCASKHSYTPLFIGNRKYLHTIIGLFLILCGLIFISTKYLGCEAFCVYKILYIIESLCWF
jgi:hypothetical protein